jgi:hypothetical protein
VNKLRRRRPPAWKICGPGARLAQFAGRSGASNVAGCLQPLDNMRRREARPMSAQSGALPEIRLQGESVVFYLDIATPHGPSRLLLRCDSGGNVWASIEHDASAHIDEHGTRHE